MDFREIVIDVARNVQDLIDEILDMGLSPDETMDEIAGVFEAVGREFGEKMVSDVSLALGASAIGATINYNENNQIRDLAEKLVRDNAFELRNRALPTEYFDVLLGRAEYTSFINARSLQKVPTLTRIATGKETCAWCEQRTGTFTYPERELFQRHDNCDCIFQVSGYNTRNGVLKNYKKARK